MAFKIPGEKFVKKHPVLVTGGVVLVIGFLYLQIATPSGAATSSAPGLSSSDQAAIDEAQISAGASGQAAAYQLAAVQAQYGASVQQDAQDQQAAISIATLQAQVQSQANTDSLKLGKLSDVLQAGVANNTANDQLLEQASSDQTALAIQASNNATTLGVIKTESKANVSIAQITTAGNVTIAQANDALQSTIAQYQEQVAITQSNNTTKTALGIAGDQETSGIVGGVLGFLGGLF